MALILTQEQLDEVKRIVAKHHAALVLQIVGPEALTDGEAALVDEDAASKILDTVRNSYLYGQALAQTTTTPDTGFEDFKEWLEKNPVQLSAVEESAVRAARQHAGAHIRHLGARVVQGVDMLYFSEDATARARLLDEEVRPAVTENLVRREGVQKLKSELQRRVGDYERDWNRVAVTEKVNAMNAGVADRYRRDHGDPWVFKRPMPDACRHCLRLHLGPDGHPRLFKLSTLQGNGTNVGLKAAEWRAVVGTTHPHCQCVLVRVPPGWGFDGDGDLVPEGEFGVRYDSEKGAQKAVELEDQLQKAFKIRGRVNFQGLPIAIEQRVGDVRRWTDPAGYGGQTRMFCAYGYVEGTRGPDGDEYDCYVGPDPTAPTVYVVHQNDPTSGEYDEDKAMLGFPDVHQARDAYLVHYDRDEFLGSITEMPVEEFAAKVLQTRRPGSMYADGMVKAEPAPSAAAFSIAGNRAVDRGGSGPNLVLGLGSLLEHLQANHTGVQITPQELAGEDVRREQMAGGFFVREDADTYRKLAAEWGVGLNVYPLDLREGPAHRLGIAALAEIPNNRRHLEHEIQRRDAQLTLNSADVEAEDRDPPFVLDCAYAKDLEARLEVVRRETDGWVRKSSVTKSPVVSRGPIVQKRGPMQKSTGPYYGPRGGKYRDPLLKVSWKEPQRQQGPTFGWRKTGQYPPGIPKPDFSSWTLGERGGTEALYFDTETQSWDPGRKELHESIIAQAFEGAALPPTDRRPVATVLMGGPGSGKSTLLKALDLAGDAVVADSDAVKKRLPEYGDMVRKGYRTAASATHHESHVVMTRILQTALNEGRDFVLDRTGVDRDHFLKEVQKFKKKGYEVRLVMPFVFPKQAVRIAEERGQRTGRFVPPGLVRRIHHEVPKSFAHVAAEADSALLVDNTGRRPQTIFVKHPDGTGELLAEDLADQFPGLENLVTQSSVEKSLTSEGSWTFAAETLNEEAQATEWDKPVRFNNRQGLLVEVFSDGDERYVT